MDCLLPACFADMCSIMQVRLGTCIEVDDAEFKGHQMIALVMELFQDTEVGS